MKQNLKKIKMLVLDVDGVLTDGRIIVDARGRETKNFNVLDGMGIVLWRQAGGKTAIISARRTSVVEHRARDLKIDKTYQGVYPKLKAYDKLLREFKLRDEDICFVGDDLPDLTIIRRAGWGVAVANARPEIKRAAGYVTQTAGGYGAVREVVEMILKAQGHWLGIMRRL
jgi:3-deoxy-D-manno-octulosonate 8-phosphate phosphatase (KDO 8-P phosphatase)